ncbi:hypothetical protein TWF506_005708 [Arthrobotrys conoides]|uniref:Uncharacterized protein n=1 Tax=Arthrobotrys conoides TaxID=74498 RepID=A0AAN8NX31_9PEZI
MAPTSEYSASEKSIDRDQPQITTTQLITLIEKFSTYATDVAQRIRKAAKEGLIVPQELVNIPDATTKLVGFLRNLKPAAGYFKPEFTEALYLRVLGMQRDYQGLSHNVDIWLAGQRAKKIVRFKPVNGNSLPPQHAYGRRGHGQSHGQNQSHGYGQGYIYGQNYGDGEPYVVSRVGPKALL